VIEVVVFMKFGNGDGSGIYIVLVVIAEQDNMIGESIKCF
jgi:hypothetical protein